jgi:hypothetical protein
LIADVTPSTVDVYYRTTTTTTWTKLASDDGAGGWNMEAGYTGSGSMVYTTGEANITVTSGLAGVYSTYILKVVFSKSSNDVLTTQRNQIFIYGDSVVTTTYMA